MSAQSQSKVLPWIAFADQFRDAIRVGFNWKRFFAEKWPIETVTLSSRPQLARCFVPWYIGPQGNEVAYDDPIAVPMRLTDVPKSIPLLNEERRADVYDYVDQFKSEAATVRFAVPTYSLPDDHHFVLDRNHRLSALTLESVPFEVTLWNVRGPLESDGLLDLIHWLPPRKGTTPISDKS